MIPTVNPAANATYSPATSADQGAQGSSSQSFAEILAAAGGSPSGAQAAALAQSVNADFENWMRTIPGQGTSAGLRQEMEKYSEQFEEVVDKAAAQGGYDDPQAFLKTLSSSELEALQHVHSLADPIDPSSLTKEGALNLLCAPDQAQDIDKDGFEMVGVAKTWQFPPPDAPADVKKAWAETVSSMSGKNILGMVSMFLPAIDPATGATPNAYLGPDTDYTALVRKAIDAANFSSRFDQPWQSEARKQQIAGLEDFLANLEKG